MDSDARRLLMGRGSDETHLTQMQETARQWGHLVPEVFLPEDSTVEEWRCHEGMYLVWF